MADREFHNNPKIERILEELRAFVATPANESTQRSARLHAKACFDAYDKSGETIHERKVNAAFPAFASAAEALAKAHDRGQAIPWIGLFERSLQARAAAAGTRCGISHFFDRNAEHAVFLEARRLARSGPGAPSAQTAQSARAAGKACAKAAIGCSDPSWERKFEAATPALSKAGDALADALALGEETQWVALFEEAIHAQEAASGATSGLLAFYNPDARKTLWRTEPPQHPYPKATTKALSVLARRIGDRAKTEPALAGNEIQNRLVEALSDIWMVNLRLRCYGMAREACLPPPAAEPEAPAIASKVQARRAAAQTSAPQAPSTRRRAPKA